jgi:hexosaminidase
MQTRTGTLISLCLLTLLHPAATVGADGQGLSTRRISVIPHPAKCEWLDGNLRVTAGTSITCEAPAGDVAHYLADTLAAHLGTAPKVEAQAQPRAGGIHLAVSGPLATLGDEGYVLTVKPDGLVLRANGPRGLFYGVQTLRQLAVPVAVASEQDQPSVEWPALHIEDVPRYRWRGMHLDVGRHFMPVEFVKQFIDLLAYHKFNTFHWHLTEDQGWRIQIERYPALTEVGAWREENGRRYGGFYTKSEVRAVVEHAAQRHVTIVPEIEMPGHSLAALAAYPKLSCTGGPFTITGKSGDLRRCLLCRQRGHVHLSGGCARRGVRSVPRPVRAYRGGRVPQEALGGVREMSGPHARGESSGRARPAKLLHSPH